MSSRVISSSLARGSPIKPGGHGGHQRRGRVGSVREEGHKMGRAPPWYSGHDRGVFEHLTAVLF